MQAPSNQKNAQARSEAKPRDRDAERFAVPQAVEPAAGFIRDHRVFAAEALELADVGLGDEHLVDCEVFRLVLGLK